jgi:SAM-dependent methyltransferase
LPSGNGDQQYLARGFRDVDAADSGKMASCLKHLNSLPAVQQYKREMLRLMRPSAGNKMADLGCGLGFDVQQLAKKVGPEGLAIGIDASHALLQLARTLPGSLPGSGIGQFVQADIKRLPFAAGCLNACKIDRVLQHLPNPYEVVKEMFRVLGPGGRVVCAEPDWATFSLHLNDAELAAAISACWRGSFQNPRIGSQLPELLAQAGFRNVNSEQQVLATDTYESSDAVFDLGQTALRLGRPLARDQEIRCAVTIFLHCSEKP